MNAMERIVAGKGGVRFESDDALLNAGFLWAKEQALAYVFEGDPVGDWYEAALPGREAFCMRDVSHQCAGAQALGLASHNRNMLLRFAQGIAESRDFCSFWEIDRHYRPAPVDYAGDGDFWYNLPANFDVVDACWRMYCWTGDRAYVDSSDFTRFYDLTATRYVQRWDEDGDGLMERRHAGFRRGIPSYNEGIGHSLALTMLDLVAIQARGYDSYAELCLVRGLADRAAEYSAKAAALRRTVNEKWWDAPKSAFYTVRMPDGTMAHAPERDCDALPAYYGGIEDETRLAMELDRLDATEGFNVECLSYMPGVFYRYGRPGRARRWLGAMLDPKLARREYPEVSFCAVGYFAEGLMGVRPHARLGRVETAPGLAGGIKYARIEGLPVFGGTVCVEHRDGMTRFENHTGGGVLWKARFEPGAQELCVDGRRARAGRERGAGGECLCVLVDCAPGSAHEAGPAL